MIINKSKTMLLERSDMPDSNWTQSDDFLVVDSRSELAKKTRQNYPDIELVVENDIVKDVVILESTVPLESIKQSKIEELDAACQQTIFAGADVTLSTGETQHFTLDEQDQSNLLGLTNQLIMGATQISWHNDDKLSACQFYSAEDAGKIINTLSVYKSYHITYCKDLRIYVNSLESADEVNAIEYGFALPETSKSDVLKYYEQIIAGA